MNLYKLLFLTLFVPIVSSQLVNGQTDGAASSNFFQLNCGDATMEIDATRGARIVSFKMDGIELLGTKSIHPSMYGSTLWLSPEGKWRGQGILDNGPYQTKKSNGSYLRLKSLDDTVRGFSFEKEFKISKKEKSFSIKYKITNIAQNSQEVAAWEVTRVPTGGLAFIPKGTSHNVPTANKMYPLLNIQDHLDVIWYAYDTATISPEKCFMGGGEGWMAYVYKNLIFIKQIPVIETGKTAPNENNIELYVNKPKTYIELENQGEYINLNKGESLSYEVKWYVSRLPEDIKAEVGNLSLLDYARRVIQHKQ